MASFRHANCAKTRGKAPPAVPVRFVLACRGGHLDEFPWAVFVHRGAPCPSPILEMFERNQSSRADDVLLTCRGCNATRSMVDAFGESAQQNLPHCRGRHPHLRTFDDEVCKEQNRTLLLGASNTWFSVALRALAIPEAVTALGQLVEDAWPQLAPIESPATLSYALQNVPALAALSGEDPDAIWEVMLARRSGEIDNNEEEADLLAPEWAQLSEAGSEANFPDFKIRERPAPPDCASLVERVVAVERLREAIALIGFTRVDPPGEPNAIGEEADVGPLCRGRPTWVPSGRLASPRVADWRACTKVISAGGLDGASILVLAGLARAIWLCTASVTCSCESSRSSAGTGLPASASASTLGMNPSRWGGSCFTRPLPTAKAPWED
jgi:hypothetical protein